MSEPTMNPPSREPDPENSGTRPEPLPPAAPRRRWLTVLLVASLGLNLLVAGMLAGAGLAHWRGRGLHSPPVSALRGLGYDPFVAALPSQARRDLARAAAGEARGLDADRAALRAQFEALLKQLRTQPFDAAEFEALLAQQSARLDARQRLGRELLLAQISAMTPEQRADYAARLERSLRAGPRLPRSRRSDD